MNGHEPGAPCSSSTSSPYNFVNSNYTAEGHSRNTPNHSEYHWGPSVSPQNHDSVSFGASSTRSARRRRPEDPIPVPDQAFVSPYGYSAIRQKRRSGYNSGYSSDASIRSVSVAYRKTASVSRGEFVGEFSPGRNPPKKGGNGAFKKLLFVGGALLVGAVGLMALGPENSMKSQEIVSYLQVFLIFWVQLYQLIIF